MTDPKNRCLVTWLGILAVLAVIGLLILVVGTPLTLMTQMARADHEGGSMIVLPTSENGRNATGRLNSHPFASWSTQSNSSAFNSGSASPITSASSRDSAQ